MQIKKTIKFSVELEIDVSGKQTSMKYINDLATDGVSDLFKSNILFDSDEYDLQAFINNISIKICE